MKKKLNCFLLLVFLLFISSEFQNFYAQAKLAQTGFNFLGVSTDARATGMGEAVTTAGGISSAMFYNAAVLADMDTRVHAGFSQMSWIADIKYFNGSIAASPFGGDYGVIALDFTRVNYGEFLFTKVANNEQGFVDLTGYPEPYAYSVKLVYAKKLSDNFSVGGRIKYAYQNLGKSYIPVYKKVLIDSVLTDDTVYINKKYGLDVLAFDFGTIYRTGFKSLAFGMTISNFSREIRYERENFQLPLTFRFGISIDLMDFLPSLSANNSFLLSVDAVHPRSYPEYLNIGCEYSFMKTLLLRVGYVTNQDDYGLTYGVGFRKFGLGFDYSFISHETLNNVQRFTISFEL